MVRKVERPWVPPTTGLSFYNGRAEPPYGDSLCFRTSFCALHGSRKLIDANRYSGRSS
jgi:hypothetical protein